MLLQFSVTNYRSLKDKAVISMKASSDKSLSSCLFSPDGKKRLVPVMSVYGANAAGKSNLINALTLMRQMVCGDKARLLRGEELPYEPFALADNVPTVLEAIFYYESIRYAYGFSYDRHKVISEYLYHWPNGREALIFSRENDSYEFRENIQEQTVLAGRTAENRLYLAASNEWNCEQTRIAYMWFFEKLDAVSAADSSYDSTISLLKKGESGKNRIIEELRHADLGISDIRISGGNDSPVIQTVHSVSEDGNDEFTLKLNQESDGTRAFFSRIGKWLNVLERKGAVLVIDEIESNLHPLLTRHLIEMFQDSEVNRMHAQLIFTTQDVGLMDLTLLRRDQIWFVERNDRTLKSEVYALTDFSPRKGENISKGYMQGRFGAVPVPR